MNDYELEEQMIEDINNCFDEDAYLQYLEEVSLEKRILEEEENERDGNS